MARIGSLLVLFVCISITRAADWPQWLGPNRDASSLEKVVPWKGSPKVLWRQPVGMGNSSPIVAEGRVFLHAKAKDTDAEEVVALDAKSGKELWRKEYERPAFRSAFGDGPRATPAAAGGKLYTYGITGVLTCWNAADGKQLWQVDALKKFEAKNIRFGASSSPLVDPNPKAYRELARSKVCGATWSHPALAEGKLYLRDNKELICLQMGE
jgi:hypothetical protein